VGLLISAAVAFQRLPEPAENIPPLPRPAEAGSTEFAEQLRRIGPELARSAPPAEATDERQPAPTYAGQTLDEWRDRIRQLDPNDPRSAAAVPGLMELVADRQVPWFTRRDAALTLGRLGKAGAPAVDLLARLLDEPPQNNVSPASWSTRALALLGPDAAEASPRLVQLLRNPARDAGDRMAAIDALARIGAGQPQSLPTLISFLTVRPGAASGLSDSLAITFRELAAQGLGLMGAEAAAAVPALLRAGRDEHESVRQEATLALAAMGPAAEIAVPGLLERLVSDDSEAVQDAAETALAAVATREAQQALAHLLGDEEPEFRWRAARSLGRMGQAAADAEPSLLVCLQDPEPQVQLQAALACQAIGVRQAEAAETLVELLHSDKRQIRIQATRSLIAAPEAARQLLEQLQQLAEQGDPQGRRAARQVLEQILPTNESPESR
ncbi:MAG: HEAT repeat domain-containing protein, partial [Planctomycetaceae bacterium]|nr:HEAT repeat domain-containing protein [Planctomycetaceae bacterium]